MKSRNKLLRVTMTISFICPCPITERFNYLWKSLRLMVQKMHSNLWIAQSIFSSWLITIWRQISIMLQYICRKLILLNIIPISNATFVEHSDEQVFLFQVEEQRFCGGLFDFCHSSEVWTGVFFCFIWFILTDLNVEIGRPS